MKNIFAIFGLLTWVNTAVISIMLYFGFREYPELIQLSKHFNIVVHTWLYVGVSIILIFYIALQAAQALIRKAKGQ